MRILKTNIWWSESSENKPSRDYIDNLSFEVKKVNYNFIDQFTVSLYSLEDFNYFEDNGKFYYYDSDIMSTKNTKLKIFKLDIWVTYNIMFFNDDERIIQTVRSTSNFMENSQIIEDSLIKSIPNVMGEKSKKEVIIQPQLGSYTLADGISQIVESPDILNSNEYYVFASEPSPVTEFVVSNTRDVVLVPVLTEVTSLNFKKDAIEYDVITLTSGTIEQTTADIQSMQAAYEERRALWPDALLSIEIDYEDSRVVSEFPINPFTQPKNVVATDEKYGAYYRTYKAFAEGVIMFEARLDKDPSTGFKDRRPEIRWIFKNPKTVLKGRDVVVIKNSRVELDLMKKASPALYLGRFILPNITVISSINKVTDTSGWTSDKDVEIKKAWDSKLVINVPLTGVKLREFKLFAIEFGEITEYNSKVFSKYLLKLIDYSYLGVEQPLQFWYDCNVRLSGKLIFPGQPAVIDRRKLLTLNNSILSLPGRQTDNTDEYNEWAKGIQASTNNGLRAANMQMTATALNSVTGAVAAGVSGHGGAGVVGGLANIGSGLLSRFNTKKAIEAKYQDARVTKVNRLETVEISDSNYITDLKSGYMREQYEVNTISNIEQFNNVIYLYGQISLKTEPLKNYFLRENFDYLEMEQQFVNNSVDVQFGQLDKVTIDRIKMNFQYGIRIWKVQPDLTIGNGWI